MAKSVLDPSLLADAEVQAWLKTEGGRAFEEEERCAAARKAAETKKLDHEDPVAFQDAIGFAGVGFSGDKDEGTLEIVPMVQVRCKSRRGRSSKRRKSGAQRRKAKKGGFTGAARRLAKS